MTKIVSFAPPRASSSRSAAKDATSASASPRKAGGRAASGSPSSQVSLAFSFDDEPAENPTAKAPTAKAAAVKAPGAKAPAVKAPAAKALKEPKTSKEPKATLAKAEPKKTSPKKVAPKIEVTAPPPELKGKRVRAPKDLALQYGGPVEERSSVPVVLEAETAKKRLTKVQREARKLLMKPDEGLLERLARATQIPIVKPKSEPRGKGWKFVCGRCGTTSYFQTPAALCDCGAIALKD